MREVVKIVVTLTEVPLSEFVQRVGRLRRPLQPTLIVNECYLLGIKDARERFEQYGIEIAEAEIDNLTRTIAGFSASSSVGQLLRGERDFWRNQLKIVRGKL